MCSRRTTVRLEELDRQQTLKLTRHVLTVGIICTKTNIHQIAREAIDNALYVCEEHFGLFKGPPVQLICPKDLTFMYVPSHLVSANRIFLRGLVNRAERDRNLVCRITSFLKS